MVLLAVLSALLIAGLLVGGTWAWWLTGRRMPRSRLASRNGLDAEAALRRHPAGRDRWQEPDRLRALAEPGRPDVRPSAGPDDDPEFIRSLERLIKGEEPGGPA
jgi:hypothetical protein